MIEIVLEGNDLKGTLPGEMCNQLPQLEKFTLFGNHFEGSIPRSIGNCTLLQTLTLQDNFFTGKTSNFYLYFLVKHFMPHFDLMLNLMICGFRFYTDGDWQSQSTSVSTIGK